jgi:predicted nucleic acid-binding protein
MRYLIDTTFVIDHLRGDEAATGRLDRMLAAGDEVFINDVVACEAWSGAVADDDPRLKTLLGTFEFVQPGPDSAHLAGRWRANARRRGWALSLSDALIAAAAAAVDGAILTRNVRDFALTPVPVETY